MKQQQQPTQTNRRDSAPGAVLLAVAVNVSMSQRITRVAGVLYVVSVLSGSWILYITKVEGPMSRYRWVQAQGSSEKSPRQQRRYGGGVHHKVVVSSRAGGV